VVSVFVEFSTDPIRLTAQGVWMHGEDRIIPRVAELFSKNLVVRPDGQYLVKIESYAAPVQTVDTAFFVRSLNVKVDGAAITGVVIDVSDGSERELDGASLMQNDDNVLYCRVPCRALVGDAIQGFLSVPCRFPPSLYHALALHAELEGGRGVITIAGRKYGFGAYNSAPVSLSGGRGEG
jgi:hypothetical protein